MLTPDKQAEIDKFIDALHEPEGTIWKADSFGWRWEVRLTGFTRSPFERGGWCFTENGAKKAVDGAILDEREKYNAFKAEEARKRRYPQPEMPSSLIQGDPRRGF